MRNPGRVAAGVRRRVIEGEGGRPAPPVNNDRGWMIPGVYHGFKILI
jgi:hypothetical protein